MKNTRFLSSVRSLRQTCCILALGLLLPVAKAEIAAAQSAAAVGQWGAIHTLDTVPVHISLLPDGRLLYWGRDKHPVDLWDIAGSSNTYTWHPETGVRSTIPNFTTNLFCSGHSFLPDGRLLVTGGHSRYDPTPDWEGIGEDDVNVFDYRTNVWTRASTRMPRGRWYPYHVTLGSGETVVVSGYSWDGSSLKLSEDGTRHVPVTELSTIPDMITLAGHIRPFTASKEIPVYPYLHLTPAGSVFVAGPSSDPSSFFDPATDGGLFTDGRSPSFGHLLGTAVTFDAKAGKVLMVGGSVGGWPIPDAQVITPASTSSEWQAADPLAFWRKYHTGTLLPDGKVLVTGGTRCSGTNNITCAEGSVRQPELWDPNVWDASGMQTGRWTQLAPSPARPGYPQGIPRVYHSMAVLLPDARVLVGGGGLPAAGGEVANGETCRSGSASESENCRTFGHRDAEIFSPPYLFNPDGTPATQPVITSAPPSVSYGETFTIGVSNATSLAKVSLVRLPSVTHGFNQDQRINFLTPIAVSGVASVSVRAPQQSNEAPPGYYMLFVVNAAGVPSKAKFIRLHQDDGYLDVAACGQIRGWAWDRNRPNTPIDVDIYDGTTKIATVPANQFRQDLLDAGKGNGFHGFSFDIPKAMRDHKAHHHSVRFAGTNNNLGSSPRSRVCDVTLVPEGPFTPARVSAGGSTWEQATQFFSYVNGRITYLRFYKASGETGLHVGRIWSDTGTLLAQVEFTNETAVGWQKAALPTPLRITAGVKYWVSYNVNMYGAKIVSGLDSPVMNWPLTAITGMYSTPAGTFPNTGSGSNFLADFFFDGTGL